MSINKSSKTIETLPIVEDFMRLRFTDINVGDDDIILDPWEDSNSGFYLPNNQDPILRIIKATNWPHTIHRVLDIPKKCEGELVITYYKGYTDIAYSLANSFKKEGINAEIKPFE
jgi:hypothetical protein